METKVISMSDLPRCKIKCGNSTIVCKSDSIFGYYCAYQFDPQDAESIEALIECLKQILYQDA